MTAVTELTVHHSELYEDLTLDTVEFAIEQIAAGRPVVVVDDEDRENEGDIVFAAELATPELVAFAMSECRGLLCVPMTGADLDRLDLEQMVEQNTESYRTAFTVSVDARDGVTTGISAADRARTIRLLADPESTPGTFVRPGHVFPLRAKDGGVLVRNGHTEAGPDLCRLAGLRPAAAICEIAKADGTMARLPDLVPFARRHGLAIISIEDLIAYRLRTEPKAPRTSASQTTTPQESTPEPSTPQTSTPQTSTTGVTRAAVTALPTVHGDFTALGYLGEPDGVEHIALVAGGLDEEGKLPDGEDVLVRVHSECLTGDVFGSLRCDCGTQLTASLDRIAAEGRGILLYLRGHEGRGIGLLPKLRAYQLQEAGRDTVDANLELGLPADARDYGAAARILDDLGVQTLRLLTNNPDKQVALEGFGLKVLGRESVPVQAGEHNLRYLLTKRDRMGHELPWLA
ncbi:3,4-dihydroxy 2-butanone 4-phosphate synthase/GTP cyclohydrolase II [Streptacidiphilus sp. MAP12-16]|uniref:3,4-dihydroxy-2-butanone-4-phosphate synthase n=1 Tax=Streptacidiphilus sp. MAP12-16 TaxID=3156300 RepID=UPI003518FFA7